MYGLDVKLPHDLFLLRKTQNQRNISDIDIDAYKIKQLKVLHEANEKFNKLKKEIELLIKFGMIKHINQLILKMVTLSSCIPKPYEEGMTKKFLPFWDGPFKITDKMILPIKLNQ